MAQSTAQASRFGFLQGLSLLFLLLLVPVALSNHTGGAASGILIFLVIFFFPGYLLLTLASKLRGSLRIVLSSVFGITCVTTAYDIFSRASIGAYFPYLIAALSVAGMILFVQQSQTIANVDALDRGVVRNCPGRLRHRRERGCPLLEKRPILKWRVRFLRTRWLRTISTT